MWLWVGEHIYIHINLLVGYFSSLLSDTLSLLCGLHWMPSFIIVPCLEVNLLNHLVVIFTLVLAIVLPCIDFMMCVCSSLGNALFFCLFLVVDAYLSLFVYFLIHRYCTIYHLQPIVVMCFIIYMYLYLYI